MLAAVRAGDVGEEAGPFAGRGNADANGVAAAGAGGFPMVADERRGHAAGGHAERFDEPDAQEQKDDEEDDGDGREQACR